MQHSEVWSVTLRDSQAPVEGPPFPWVRATGLTFAVWLSLTVAGMLGGRLGERTYVQGEQPPAPYSERQIDTLRSVAPTAALVARRDSQVWVDTTEIGRSLAHAEGTLLGSAGMAALWALAAVGWVASQLRRRWQAPSY